MKRKQAIAPILFILCLALLLTGCGSKRSSYTARTDYFEPEAVEYDAAYDWDEAPAAALSDSYSAKAAGQVATTAAKSEDGGAGLDLTGAVAGRKIIKNGDLSIQTREFEAFLESLDRSILSVGGYVEASSINGNSYTRSRMRSADVTARIPAEKLDAFCDQVSELGNVTYKNLYTRDVTLTYVDLESHVKALRTEQQTLMALLEKAESVEDIIVIQTRLSDVLYEIESYESTLRTFDDQIAFSSVHLSISEVARETAVEQETASQEIARRFRENWEDVKEGVRRFGIDVASDLPMILVWVATLGVLALVVVLLVKGAPKRKARREKRQALKRQRKYREAQARSKQQQSDATLLEKTEGKE